jgi:sugar lactone lactonase YvrE
MPRSLRVLGLAAIWCGLCASSCDRERPSTAFAPEKGTKQAGRGILLSTSGSAPELQGGSLFRPFDRSVVRTRAGEEEDARVANDSFTVPTASGSWFVTVEKNPGASASVAVNGKRILGPEDSGDESRKDSALLRAPFTPSTGANAIQIRVHGEPGASVRVTVAGIIPVEFRDARPVHAETFFEQIFPASGTARVDMLATTGLFWLDVVDGHEARASVSFDGRVVFGDPERVSGGGDEHQLPTAVTSIPVNVAPMNQIAVALRERDEDVRPRSVTVRLRGFIVDTMTVETPSSPQFGRVEIRYHLRGAAGRIFNALIEFSTSGKAGPFARATEALGAPSQGTAFLTATGLDSSNAFVWNSFFDLDARGVYETAIVVRVTALVPATGDTNASAESNQFVVDNRLVTPVAGSGSAADIGDGGPATNALFVNPNSLAQGPDGTIYVNDNFGNRVRAFQVGGTITTVAGTSIPGASLAEVLTLATKARFTGQEGIAVDSNGVIFVGIGAFRAIFAVNPLTKQIFIAAGGGTDGDGPALNASFTGPRALKALPPVQNKQNVLLIVEQGANRVRRLQYDFDAATGNIPNAVLDTLCNRAAIAGFSGDGGPAPLAALRAPQGVSIDGKNNVFVTDTANQVVRMFPLPDPNGAPGAIQTVAGTPGLGGFTGDGGPATAARFLNPTDVACDLASGAIYVTDRGNSRVRRLTTGGAISTFAGNGAIGDAGFGGPATEANVTTPSAVLVDARDGSVIIVAQGTQRVVRVTGTGTLELLAGRSPLSEVGDGGSALSGTAREPRGIAVGLDGSVYFAALNRIRRVEASTGTMTTVVGNGIGATSGDGGPAGQALINAPQGAAVDRDGNLFIGDFQGHRVRRIDRSGRITTVVGTGAASSTGDGGLAEKATLNQPFSVAFAPSGAMFVSENLGARVRRIDPVTNVITTVCGGGTSTAENVPATSANIQAARGLAIDPIDETVYVGVGSQTRIRKFKVGGNITTVAGVLGATPGYNGDGIPATQATLSDISHIALDRLGNLYIVDQTNHRLRRVDRSGIITTVAGTGGVRGDGGGDPDGKLSTIGSFDAPQGVFVDLNSNIYLSDRTVGRVFRFRLP